jgi:hypothetical protein
MSASSTPTRGAFGGQRQRQVDGGGRLADAALARGHGDDVLHVRHQLQAALHGVRNDLGVDVDADVAHARQRAQGADHAGADGVELAFGRVAEFDVERRRRRRRLEILDSLTADIIFIGIWVNDFGQCSLDVFYCDAHVTLRM